MAWTAGIVACKLVAMGCQGKEFRNLGRWANVVCGARDRSFEKESDLETGMGSFEPARVVPLHIIMPFPAVGSCVSEAVTCMYHAVLLRAPPLLARPRARHPEL
jgi:hypothetical protein